MYFLIAVAMVFLTACSQILLKHSARSKDKDNSSLRSLCRPLVVFAYGILFIVAVVNVVVYKHIDLKFAAIFLPLTYLMVILASIAVLGERLSRKQWLGSFIIVIGILVFGI